MKYMGFYVFWSLAGHIYNVEIDGEKGLTEVGELRTYLKTIGKNKALMVLDISKEVAVSRYKGPQSVE